MSALATELQLKVIALSWVLPPSRISWLQCLINTRLHQKPFLAPNSTWGQQWPFGLHFILTLSSAYSCFSLSHKCRFQEHFLRNVLHTDLHLGLFPTKLNLKQSEYLNVSSNTKLWWCHCLNMEKTHPSPVNIVTFSSSKVLLCNMVFLYKPSNSFSLF